MRWLRCNICVFSYRTLCFDNNRLFLSWLHHYHNNCAFLAGSSENRGLKSISDCGVISRKNGAEYVWVVRVPLSGPLNGYKKHHKPIQSLKGFQKNWVSQRRVINFKSFGWNFGKITSLWVVKMSKHSNYLSRTYLSSHKPSTPNVGKEVVMSIVS